LECDEAAVRIALDDAAPLYRDAPEARKARNSGERTIQVFMREALPTASNTTHALAGELILTTLSAVGKQLSEPPRTSAEVEASGDAMATCFAPISRLLSIGESAITNHQMGKGWRSEITVIREPHAGRGTLRCLGTLNGFLEGGCPMDWNRVEGNWKEVKGKVKEKWGKLTDDDLTAINGQRDQLEGRLQQRYGYAKDQARKDVDTWFSSLK
jgi:uncharacterized protein YjbJ (UPF0337 family)